MYNPISSQNILVGKKGDFIDQIFLEQGNRLSAMKFGCAQIPGKLFRQKATQAFCFIDLSSAIRSLRQ